MSAVVAASVLLIGQAIGPPESVVGPLEVGSASGESGEVLDLPVHFSSPHPLCSFSVLVRYDRAGLDFLGYEVQESEAQGVDPHAVIWEVFEDFDGSPREVAMFGILSACVSDHRIPPGEHFLLGRLRFRIHGEAEAGEVLVEPVQYVRGLNTTTTFVVEVDGVWESADAGLVAGGVTVLPPTRPRPVDDLACKQYLDLVELRFSASGGGVGFEPYDGFDVLRDGVLVSTLEAEARSHSEPLPELGPHTYNVVGRRGDESSLSASCEVLVVAPAAPPPWDLLCLEEGRLTWRNGAGYERVLVLRNGELIAELPGNAWYFDDTSRPEGATVYSVVGGARGLPEPRGNLHRRGGVGHGGRRRAGGGGR